MTLTNGGSFNDKVNFIWSVADLLRGDFKRSEYAKVILPLVVIRRLDCVLGDTKAAVVERGKQLAGKVDNPDPALQAVAGREFYNTSPLDFARLTADPANVEANLRAYIGGFSLGAFDVIERFRFDAQITRLAEADLLYQVVARFADIDLHTDQVGNTEMGYVYEELIRRFSEQSNETAGEHFTPREVIRLMVDLLCLRAMRTDLLERLAMGSTHKTIYMPDIESIRVPLPPVDEQADIVERAWAELRRLDALVDAKQQMIALLWLRLSAWADERIADLPRVSVRRVLTEPPMYGASESGESEPEDLSWPRYLRITDLDERGRLRDRDRKYLPPQVADPYLLSNEDLLVARSGATVGKTYMYDVNEVAPAAFAGYLIRFRFNRERAQPGFVMMWSKTADYWCQIAAGSIQATIQNVSADRFQDLLLPLPPTEAQAELVAAFDAMTQATDDLTGTLTRQIDLLRERRQALITAAVIGEMEEP